MLKRTLLIALATAVQAAPPPFHTSAPSLPLANGATTAIYDVKERAVTGFFDHPYKKFRADDVSLDFCKRASFGPPDGAGKLEYLVGTGILRETTRHQERYAFCPMGEPFAERQLVLLTRSSIPCRYDLDFRVGKGRAPNRFDKSDTVDHEWYGEAGEKFARQGSVWTEKGVHQLWYLPLNGKAHVEGPKLVVEAPAGWSGVVISQGKPGASLAPEALLARERKFWVSYHAVEPDLVGVAPARRNLYWQSTAFLKMAQVRERDRPSANGQILASLKDKWARCWVRDGSYAAVGLARSGHGREARQALEFMLRTRKEPGHDYLAMINAILPKERQLDDYLVSVCRYWGDGSEESDWNDAGPNLEWDDWGLFLWAFAESADPPFARRYREKVERLVAEPLVRLIEPNGLLAPDSSIWEHHWNLPLAYDGRRQYAYSSIAACNGLKRFAPLSSRPEYFLAASERLRQGVLTALKHPQGGLASSLEDLQGNPALARDAAVLEAVNWGLTDDKAVVSTVFDSLPGPFPNTPGLKRNDDGNWYDSQEWLLLDLRGAVAWQKVGEPSKAQALLDWVTGWGSANFDALGELLDKDGNFEGPFPMAGFGPGAYVLAIDELSR